ncbi:aspartate aminotransferase [Thermosipho melanesiensis]|uniref:Aminotransferase, class I and II n=2 Tax=Thermosipho melanesiensis TaxID=46541 RepID=A6LJZ4_THEM4|nr:aspartate aminotransferase [Thermosipho melanesiensis]ABR30245.1 aminotransferase, class I and II [Thermosipho melanesiensis BI429]APT73433.1 aspartate aminotransferase [Thermosipho melanesiensis]OOC37376.1 aspartate aminotransferase [Thermosipho melanesiensis]OOC39738.1 aspartate aminotransferase [Thermosipho melanesiensis]OOC39843.1 aspartate aminotransferase [Thermosipho melanesiensis]
MNIIDEIPQSKTLEINALARKLKMEGKDVINLTTGEPDFPTPDRIKKKAIEALEVDFTKYTDSKGIPELRKTISKFLEKKGIHFTSEEIIVTNGGKQALFNSILSIVEKDDEVILISPYWVSYPPMVMLSGANIKILETKLEENFYPNLEKLESLITENTKAIIVNSPNNPTSTVYPRKIIEGLSRISKKYDMFVIADEVYDVLVYDDEYTSLTEFVEPQKLIYINAFSKSFSMTGWRIGFVATKNREVLKRIAKVQAHSTSGINSIAQYAALEILKVDNSYMIEEFRKRRDFVVKKAKSIGLDFVKPSGAFYLFFKVNTDDEKFCKKLLEEKMVALVPGSAFNAKGFVRLSFANSIENIEKAFERIKEFLGA